MAMVLGASNQLLSVAKLKINYKKSGIQSNSNFVKYGMVVITILLICLFLPKQPRFSYDYQKGKPWNHENLVAPYNFAILKTQDELDRDRQQILKTVPPIYNANDIVAKEQIDQFEHDINEKWRAAQLDTIPGESIEDYKTLGLNILNHLYQRGIITINSRYQAKGEQHSNDAHSEYNFILVRDNIAQQKNTADCYTIESAYEYSAKAIHSSSRIQQKKWLEDLLKNYITINNVFNEGQSEKAEQNAIANISTTRGIVQKDELIAEQGKVISNDTFQKLESLRKVYEDEAQIGGNQVMVMLGNFIMVSIIISLLVTFLYFFRKDIYINNRLLSIIFIVIIVMLGILSWAISLKIPSLYFIPYCGVPIIFRILFDTRIALNIHLLMVLLAALFVPNSFDFVFLQLITGIVAIYSIRTMVKREQFLISTAVILTSYILAYTGLMLTRDRKSVV